MVYSKEEKLMILNIYEPAKHNAYEAKRLLKETMNPAPSTTTIRDYWRLEGYEINPHGGQRPGNKRVTDYQKEEIIKFYENNRTLSETARRFNLNNKTVRKILTERVKPSDAGLEERVGEE